MACPISLSTAISRPPSQRAACDQPLQSLLLADVPTRQGTHWPQLSSRKNAAIRSKDSLEVDAVVETA